MRFINNYAIMLRYYLISIIALISILNTFGQNHQYDSLVIIAKQTYKEGNYRLSAEHYHNAFQVFGGKAYPQDRYMSAKAWSLIGVYDSAFFALFRLAEKSNYLELNMLLKEKAFLSLLTDDRWLQLLHLINPRNEVYNDSLAILLSEIRENDQKYRHMLDGVRNPYGQEPSDTFKSILKKIVFYDSLDLLLVSSIIDKYGWLSQNEVSSEGNSALWLVIQHADLEVQVKYFPIMKEAVKNGKAKQSELAYLEDRILMRQGKKQLYGTQYKLNPTSHQMELWDIEDPINLNNRRHSVGLGDF
jgi:hypothetical protein